MKNVRGKILIWVLIICMLMPQTVWGADIEESEMPVTGEQSQQEEEVIPDTEDQPLGNEIQDEESPTIEESPDSNGDAEENFDDASTEQTTDENESEETDSDLDQDKTEDIPEQIVAEEETVQEQEPDEEAQVRPEGWFQEKDGIRFYHADGSFTENDFQEIDGKLYYFDENGFLATGWVTVQDQIYYLKQTGDFGKIGQVFVGLQNINGNTYFFSQSGALQTGWQKIGSCSYYFQKSGSVGTLGKMLTGWLLNGGKIYYLKKTGDKGVKGRMFTGWVTIGGKKFYFDNTGAMATGWNEIGGKLYYFKLSGNYGVKGARFSGMQNISGKTYYFSSTGILQTGWQKVNGYYYYFQKSGSAGALGKMLTGWLLNGGEVYYLKQTGAKGVKGKRFTGWVTIGGKTFYFDKNGKMQTGWQKIGNKNFYFKKTGDFGVKGQMFTGLQKISQKTYYFKKTGAFGVKGARLNNYTYKENGVAYHFDENGVGEKIKMYTLHFYSADGKSEYHDLQVKVYKGEKYKLPELPVRSNYIGIGWSQKKNASSSSANKPGTAIMVTGDMNFYGCWEKGKNVQFFYNSGSGEYKSLRKSFTSSSETIVLPSIKSAAGYTFLGWSDKPGQNSYPSYRAGERIDVSNSMKLYSVVTKNPVAGPDSASVSQEYDHVFFIGDSRTVGMQSWVSGQDSVAANNVTFFCKSRMGLSWFQENRASMVKQIKDAPGRKAIIWNLGVNNLYNISSPSVLQTIANSYVTEMNKLAETLKSNDCDLYFMSVNPLNDVECVENGLLKRESLRILDFNYLVRTRLRGYQYIDTYNYLINTGFQLIDGIHYTSAVYGKIYNKAIETIDAKA